MSVVLRKCSFNAKSCYGPVVFPRGPEEPWEFWEAPRGLLRGREKQRRKQMRGEGEGKGCSGGSSALSQSREPVCVSAQGVWF